MKSAKYKFLMPSKLLFGEGCSNDAGKWAKEYGGRNILLVSDKGIEKAGIAEQIRKVVEKEGLSVITYYGIHENPTVENVHIGRDLIAKENIDIVVALGGGSPMDAAKAMTILAAHEGSIVEYELGLKPFVKRGIPLIVIPTTAGTGSETTMGAVISDHETHRKIDVVSPLMAPTLSLVDPLLTYSLPPGMTGATGMDALTHSIEGYTATLASPLTDTIHLKAISLIGTYLLQAYHNGTDADARSNMMMASMISGIGFPNSGLGSVHGLSLPLGGHYDIPHGIANAIMLPHVMSFNLEACPEKFIDIAEALGAENATPEGSVEAVIAFRKELKIPLLSSYGVPESDLPALAGDALGRNSNCVTNPRLMSEQDAVDVYKKALDE